MTIKRIVALRVQLIERIEVQSKFEEEQRKCDQEDTPSYRCVTQFHFLSKLAGAMVK